MNPLDQMNQIPDDQSELTMSVLMTPDMANFSGNVHGGAILKLLDQVAYACASRYSGSYVVTLSVDKVNFKEPIYVGGVGHILSKYQPCWTYLNGGRDPSGSTKYSRSYDTTHQYLLFHNGCG